MRDSGTPASLATHEGQTEGETPIQISFNNQTFDMLDNSDNHYIIVKLKLSQTAM